MNKREEKHREMEYESQGGQFNTSELQEQQTRNWIPKSMMPGRNPDQYQKETKSQAMAARLRDLSNRELERLFHHITDMPTITDDNRGLYLYKVSLYMNFDVEVLKSALKEIESQVGEGVASFEEIGMKIKSELNRLTELPECELAMRVKDRVRPMTNVDTITAGDLELLAMDVLTESEVRAYLDKLIIDRRV